MGGARGGGGRRWIGRGGAAASSHTRGECGFDLGPRKFPRSRGPK